MNVPRTLPYHGRTLNYSGPGRVTGSHLYLDLVRGKALEMFVGEVVQTGRTYALVQIRDNHTMPAVRVDHAMLNGAGPGMLGMRLLVGPVHYEAAGPKGDGAWQLGASPRPKAARQFGVVARIAASGTYGQIMDQEGRVVFVHQNHCRPGTFVLGRRVSFVLDDQGRGPMALDVASA
jgi:cold shock CspA family protein